jgi:hypothetical protein
MLVPFLRPEVKSHAGRNRHPPCPVPRWVDPARSPLAVARGHTMGPEAEDSGPPRLEGPGVTAAQVAEDRGFEPRKGVDPNRISSAPLRVTDTSARGRDCAGTQVTTAVTCRAVPGLTGTAWPFCACLVRAQCVRADRPVRQAER